MQTKDLKKHLQTGDLRIIYDDASIQLMFTPKDAALQEKTWWIRTEPDDTLEIALELALQFSEQQYFKLEYVISKLRDAYLHVDGTEWQKLQEDVLTADIEDVMLHITRKGHRFDVTSFQNDRQVMAVAPAYELKIAMDTAYVQTAQELTKQSKLWNDARNVIKAMLNPTD